MNATSHPPCPPPAGVGAAASGARRRGSVLVLVMWILFGLISITLYFAHSMSYELRSSDNREAGLEAEQAIEGSRRYLSLMISNISTYGSMPSPLNYQNAAVPIGDAHVWFIGRTNADNAPATTPTWGLRDENSKINLNTANSNMLAQLPRMTPDLINSILAWKSTNTTSTTGGAESDTYQRLSPAYTCKNAPFESIEELRLIYNMDTTILYGEDPNQNGILDPNENDGELLPPSDNQDGRLDPGILEYVTIWSREPSMTTNGSARVTLGANSTAADLQNLQTNMQTLFGTSLANQVLARVSTGGSRTAPPMLNPAITCPLIFYQYAQRAGMTQAQFVLIEPYLRGTSLNGLININTASSIVISCLPGMDINTAAQVVAYRTSNQGNTLNQNTVSWVPNAITDTSVVQRIAPYITGRSYQYTADVAALGHDGRGYRRTKFIFDVSNMYPTGTVSVVYRQDLTHLGWALGKQVRDRWQLGKKTP